MIAQQLVRDLERIGKQAAYIADGLERREGKTFWVDPVAVEFLNAMLERRAEMVREEWNRKPE